VEAAVRKQDFLFKLSTSTKEGVTAGPFGSQEAAESQELAGIFTLYIKSSGHVL
jgi:hypothetical protein